MHTIAVYTITSDLHDAAEGIFKTLLPGLLETGCEKFFLLTSGKSNSLAASLEILSYLQLQGLSGEVLHGEFPLGPVTVFKVSGDLTRCFIAEGEVLRNSYEDNLCRTQVCVRLSPADARYFLTRPIGNHHILLPGHHKDLLEEFCASIL